uniref:Uncharacterized protein n=1 Tax=Opuntia streptacantha TaxID=393608 RepID=A0A7C9CC51_OPUST
MHLTTPMSRAPSNLPLSYASQMMPGMGHPDGQMQLGQGRASGGQTHNLISSSSICASFEAVYHHRLHPHHCHHQYHPRHHPRHHHHHHHSYLYQSPLDH